MTKAKTVIDVTVIGAESEKDCPLCNAADVKVARSSSRSGFKPMFVNWQQFSDNWDSAFGGNGQPN